MSTAIAYNPVNVKTTEPNGNGQYQYQLNSTGDQNLDILREFLYFASHDLNNPIGQIQMLVDDIKNDEKNNLSSESKAFLDLVGAYAFSAQNTLEKLLSYARTTAVHNEQEDVNLRVMVEDLFNSLNIEHKFTCTYKGLSNVLKTDKVPLENVLRNLIANAMNHHDKMNGNIEVDISHAGNNRLLIRVKDDGPGVPVTLRSEIFKPFKSFGSSKNSGLGLALVSAIVAQNGGRIEHATRHPRGSIFYFTWPAMG